jgi:outer membrane autotransporter protein
MNELLIDGTATAGILDAVPSLLAADGFTNEAAMSRLSSEPYASAMQIGVEKGLALAGAARAMQMGHGDQAGLFSFGQMFGNWRRLPGHDDTGISRANVSTYGVLGGIGFGSQEASVGAFIGYVDGKQNIAALGARTEADGVIAGVIGKAEMGGFDASALIAWDGSKADTRRELNASTTAASSYKLRGWTFDAALGYTAPIGSGWTLRPALGVSHIATNRGDAKESGAAHFDLIVDGKKTGATLLSGAIAVQGSAEARLQPWASLGVRHQLAGNLTSVSARFVDTPTSYTLPGVARDRTLATVEAGLNAKVSSGVALFANVNGEFGADTNAMGGRIGARVSF